MTQLDPRTTREQSPRSGRAGRAASAGSAGGSSGRASSTAAGPGAGASASAGGASATAPGFGAGASASAAGASGSAARIAPPKLGRKIDHTRDPQILDAAIDVLAETGYDGMTIDMVAARAKAGKATLYRRWPSKAELVIDAVACMKRNEADYARLPDTGSLRGDLVALIRPHSIEQGERKMQVMAGLMSMLSQAPELAEAANAAIVEPRVSANRMLMVRAIERGEISADCDVDTLALITPSMTAYRALILRKPIDRAFLISLIDGVLLPAVGLRGSGNPPGS